MSILSIKIIAALAILGVGIVGGLIPLLAARRQAGRRYLSLGNALAGGIFLGAGFIHLLPEAAEALEEVAEYPLAALLAALGVGVLLLIDRVVFESSRAQGSEQAGGAGQPIYPIVLLVVLSIHSVIAGIALGLEPEVAASVLVMVGILFHKGSAAFALMVSAHSSGADKARLRLILTVFVLMTPLGILLGTVAANMLEGPAASLIEGSFNALAAGTFIYVAILDVIDAEMSRFDDRLARFVSSALKGEDDVAMPVRDTDRILKFLLVLAGLGSMAILGIWM
ncbi:MAG: ZIP family metal transporter [Gammaproteobacteria bacterium]|nr:ZIP family metal transporter [Gammaproteobacteria bacterium]MDE0364643.1 ZIP family metal transporter [Gammaproteobacteria bacterium]